MRRNRFYIIAMSGFLFENIIFGPVKSRRLGVSLGINLLPTEYKYCTFNCIYCECGWTLPRKDKEIAFPSREEVKAELEKRLISMKSKGQWADALTFAGNGEPTTHPDFNGIVDDTIELRNQYFPEAKITVLSNSTMLANKDVVQALLKVDKNILKLDAGTEEMYRAINNPRVDVKLKDILELLGQFKKGLIIQTLFLKGEAHGIHIDNTTDEEVSLWIEHLRKLKPEAVMIYPIARATPAEDLVKIEREKLMEIASKVEALGIETEVYD